MQMLAAAAAPRTARLAGEALAIRRCVRPRLLQAGTPAPVGPPPSASVDAWRTFLLTERCALPLTARPAGEDGPGSLGEAARPLIERQRMEEMRRVLMARAQVRELEEVAREIRAPVVLLKGGVTALHPNRAVDLNDLDVLAPHDALPRLSAALQRRGYAGRHGGALHHLPPHRKAGALAVELHRALPHVEPETLRIALDRALPVDGAPGLLRLAPADHLWHALLHLVLQHPERRSCLRDLLVVRDAAAACDGGERAEVEARIDAHGQAEMLRRVLAAAAGAQDDQALEALAATRYAGAVAAFLSGRGEPPRRLWGALLPTSAHLLEPEYGRPLRSRLLARTGQDGPLGHAARVALRAGRLAVLLPAAALLARAGRRAAVAGRASSRQG